MKPFRQFVHDIDWGFDTPRDERIQVYLPTHEPVLSTTEGGTFDAAHWRDAIASGYNTHVITVDITSLVPTQAMVSPRKVLAMMKRAEELPLVIPVGAVILGVGSPTHGFLILDGHHRVCAAAMNQVTQLRVRVVD
jgi:hypothetical protein